MPREWDDTFRDHSTAARIHAMVSVHYHEGYALLIEDTSRVTGFRTH